VKRFILLLSLSLFIVCCADSPPELVTREVTRVNQVVVTRIVTRPPGKLCTLLGCGYGLVIKLERNTPSDFTIIVEYDESGESIMETRQGIGGFWNSGDVTCDLLLLTGTPNKLQLTAIWNGTELSKDYEPVYEEYLPNGPGCEPVCKRATLSFEFTDP
jgi:hypothetical protein